MTHSSTDTAPMLNKNASSKMMAYRLSQLRQKMATLQQERDGIRYCLGQELLTHLTHADAFDVDFETLLGGILEVITEAKAGNGETEGWKKSGGMFLLNQTKTGQKRNDQGREKSEKIKPRGRENIATRERAASGKNHSDDGYPSPDSPHLKANGEASKVG